MYINYNYIAIIHIIIFKLNALYPTESYRCINLLATVPAVQQLY